MNVVAFGIVYNPSLAVDGMHQKNLPNISFQPDPLQVCDLRRRDLWKIGDSPFHAIGAVNRYGAFFSWINNPHTVLWFELGEKYLKNPIKYTSDFRRPS